MNKGSFPGNVAPTASISGPSSGDARTSLTFTANASDGDGDDLAYSWDFGDGKIEANQSSVSHSWSTGGSYTVEVTVSDMKGGTVTQTLAVTISDPLENWTQRTSGTTNNLYDVVNVGGTLYVSGHGRVLTSSDGAAWTTHSLGGNGNDHMYGITYGAGVFVMVGMDYDFGISSWVSKIYSSTNGTSWTQRYMQGAGIELKDVVYAEGKFVVVGYNGTILTSTDGVSWSPTPSGVTTNLHGIAHDGSQFVIVGANSVAQGGTVLNSPDGLNWTNTSSGAGTSQGFFEVEYLNDLFIAGGFYTRIRYSENGGDTFQTNRTGDHTRIHAFAYGNGVYFASGLNLTDDPDTDISLLSTDGKNWDEVAASQTGRNEAIFFENTFITVGNGGQIWQSDEIPALSGAVVWQDDQFSGESENTGFGDDFDGDGVLNIFEYISGTDAKDATSHTRPLLGEESGYLTLTLDKDPSIGGVSIEVEASKDMLSWDTTDIVVITDSADLLKVRLDLPMTDPTVPQKFLRIKATVQ